MQTQTHPQNPINAVTHPNPYPYYADLVAHQPVYHDQTLGCWVAASADAVTAVLTSDICRVRPAAEPVPKSLMASPAADVFRYLVRMNDGEKHQPFKRAVSAALVSVDAGQTAREANKSANRLFDQMRPDLHPKRLMDFAFQLPVYAVASLLGVPDDRLPQTALWTSEFVACLAPASTQAQIERGSVAAANLLDLFDGLLTAASDGLLAALAREAKVAGCGDRNAIIPNGVGFLSQTYEATAGLIGNTLVALSSDVNLRAQVINDPHLLRQVLQEVLRCDSPVQNTRRFLAQDGLVAGQHMHESDMILVLLAAANRDPTANPNPDRFDIFRPNRRLFTFGVGIHACPGEQIATMIAAAALEPLLKSGMSFDQLGAAVRYRPSANTRIPLFG